MKTDPDTVTGTPATNGSAADVAKDAPLADGGPTSESAPAAEAAPEAKAEDTAEADDAPEPAVSEPIVDREPEPAVPSEEPSEPVAAEPAEPVAAEPAEPVAVEPVVAEPVAAEPAEPAPVVPGEPAPVVQEPRSPGFLGGLLPPRSGKAWALVVTLAVVVLVALAGLGWGGYKWFTALPDGVAFRIDGVDVTEQQLDDQVQTYKALYGLQPPGPEDPVKLDSFRKDVAKTIAGGMAMDNAAAERKIVVADRQAQDFLTKYVAATYGEGQAGRDAFVKDLADKNTSEPKVLTEIKRTIATRQMFGQVVGDVPVTDDDVKQAFDTRKAEFGTPERREIHNIVVKTQVEADALIGELKSGANFEALATQRSLDEVTKASGGNLGLVSARDLEKQYSDAAFAAPVGGLIGPVVTQQAAGPMYNVGKVVQAQPAVPAEFEKVKEGVRRLLMAERADATWRAFSEEQLKKADVKYSEKYQPADPTGVPVPGAAPGAPAPPR